MAGRLEGRIALVTGASSGLGRRFASVIAGEGAKVVVAARRKERLDDLVKEIGADKAFAVECDVTDEAAVIAMYDAAEKRFGLVDTIVNNAGMTHSDNAVTQSVDEFRRIMDLNVTSVWMVAREGARRLIKAGPEKSRARADRQHRQHGGAACASERGGVLRIEGGLRASHTGAGAGVGAVWAECERAVAGVCRDGTHRRMVEWRGRTEDYRQDAAPAGHGKGEPGRGDPVPVFGRREVRDGDRCPRR
jgi:hypothetical protein